jgi:hypothetical protein
MITARSSSKSPRLSRRLSSTHPHPTIESPFYVIGTFLQLQKLSLAQLENSRLAAAILLAAVVAIAAWLYSIARSPLPELDGIDLRSGISGPVSVIRDSQGVPQSKPQVSAIFFAQGYVTAQDRLFNGLMSRAAAGELSRSSAISP